jgi:N-acetylgalactosamine-N,N'-diacetylbacillosaminyl-diphospho-undecaprenol 4-alpha-N-acetylgalactosaminyltransferase
MNSTINYPINSKLKIVYIENSNPFESGIWKLIKIPFLAIQYAIFLKRNNIDISFSFLTRPNYVNILGTKLIKSKCIISERSNPSYQYKNKSIHGLINTSLIKWLYPKSNAIIANSIGNRNDLIDNFNCNKNKTFSINNPIDLEKIERIVPEQHIFNKSYFNFITVGRLITGKNHELLIHAWAKLNNPNIRLYIFGKGDLKNDLEALIIKLNLGSQIFIMDFSENIFEYLKAANAFVFSSNHEGFPNVLVEAMASGLPIISTNCYYGPSEIMGNSKYLNIEKTQHTKYGILVPVNNVDEIYKAVNYLTSNSVYYNGCKVNVKVRARVFEKSKILSEYSSIIYKVIGK